MVDLKMVAQLLHDLQSYTIMWYSNNGLQSITVAVDCGSALDHNGLAARTSLVTDPRWVGLRPGLARVLRDSSC